MESLAVIVPTLERPAAVQRLLPSVIAQSPSSSEIVVVDQSGPAARDELAGAIAGLGDPRVTHLAHGPPGLPAARNAGLAATRGGLVLFLDDDVELLPGAIAGHLAAYRDPSLGGVVGRIVERRLRPNAWRTVNRVGRSGRVRTRLDGPDACEVETLKGANMSLRRIAIQAAGGFDPGFAGTSLFEDADLTARVRRMGWRLRYEPDAAVIHRHDPDGGVRTGRPDGPWWRFHNAARFVRRHHGLDAMPELLVTHALLAAREGLRQRDPRRVAELLRALGAGWWATSA